MPQNNTSADRRALKVLFDTYWTSQGWRDDTSRSTTPEDFAYAKHAGVMFDPIRVSHDEVVDRALAAVNKVQRRAVVDAFLASLSSRRLEIRSALGSFAVLQHFPQHAMSGRGKACPVCDTYDAPAEEEDLNVLNFERFKWGGVRHLQPLYASLDLELFQKIPPMAPTADDVTIFHAMLKAIEAAPAKTTAPALEKHLAKVFKSNKSERDIVIGILGYCGILATQAHPGFRRQFVRESDRDLPGHHCVEMAYPACWWKRSDGINQEALADWFGHVL